MRKLNLVIILLLIFCIISFADDKFGPNLKKELQNIRSNEKIPVVVLLEGLPSFSDIANEYRFLGDRNIIREQVIHVLKDKAESLHYWLKQFCESRALSGQIEGFKSIWIVNGVALKATPEAIREIANQPNVAKIILDKPVKLLLDKENITWGLEKINAPEVWKYYDGTGVTVAVIDTGVNEHPDLQGRVIDGNNYVDPNKPPRDDHSHGTHCAGTVAGNGTMGTKTGVAPNATIMAIKVLGANGSGSWSNLWLAIEEAVTKKANVISMSLGGRANDDIRNRLRLACKNAIDAGVTPVIAAGNSGPSSKTVGSPGDVPEVITVGATNSYDRIAYFSSRGPVTWNGVDYVKPDVCAPGVNVKSCSYNSNGYRTMSGTSMATPHVAGVTALIVNANPDLTPQEIKEILERTATDLGEPGKDNVYGSGRVNADKAVLGAKTFNKTRDGRWEMVVKEMSFKVYVDENGNVNISKTIENDLMPATVTIWVDVKEPEGRKGYYHVKFILKGPNGTKTGEVKIDFDNIPTDPNKYDPKYGFNCGNFELVKGTYTGSVVSIEPNPSVKNTNITIVGKATWPPRSK